MTYHVIAYFTDKQDHDRPYHVGDVFPRIGKTVTKQRIDELASGANRRGIPLIAPDAVEDFPKLAAPIAVEDKPKRKRGRKPKN